MRVTFDGRTRNVPATFVDDDSLLVGVKMLQGYRLTVDFLDMTVELVSRQ